MSTFSEVLTEYIKAKHVKVAPMTKYCGIDRSTMYKLISGKRNPPSKDIFEKMAQFMHLTPAEIQRFEEAWEVTVIGPEVYYKRKSVENFIRHFPSHSSVSPDEFIFSSKLIQNNQKSDCTVLTSLQSVNYFIHKMFLAEASRSSGKISLFLQPDHEFVFHLLSTLAPSDTLEVQHILCLNSEDTFTENHELINLKYLHEIFPIYMSGLNYTLWYYYDNIQSHYHNLNVFPCMILTSDAALMVSPGSFTKAAMSYICFRRCTILIWKSVHSFSWRLPLHRIIFPMYSMPCLRFPKTNPLLHFSLRSVSHHLSADRF